jgi:hypothetical protein
MSIGYLSQNGMNNVFNQWSVADANVNQYGFGQLFNENGEPKVKQIYPGMWVNPVTTSVDEYALTRNYQIIIYDLIFDSNAGVSNQNLVVSDCEEIAFRLIRFLRLNSELFDITLTPTVTPMSDKWLDDVSGVIVDISINFNAESSDCEDPNYNFNIKSNNI